MREEASLALDGLRESIARAEELMRERCIGIAVRVPLENADQAYLSFRKEASRWGLYTGDDQNGWVDHNHWSKRTRVAAAGKIQDLWSEMHAASELEFEAIKAAFAQVEAFIERLEKEMP